MLFSLFLRFNKIINHLYLSMIKTDNDAIFRRENAPHDSRSSKKAEKSHGHNIISVQISIDLITGLSGNWAISCGLFTRSQA
jgi:hypothetical protein